MATSFLDENVETNTVYEYRVIKPHENGSGNGYLISGIDLEPPVNRGILILVVEASIQAQLGPEIRRYCQDVSADGWRVKELMMEASEPDTVVKQAIRSIYEQSPDERHALFLLGHIAVPYSGRISPDGHNNHVGAWPGSYTLLMETEDQNGAAEVIIH